MTADVKSRAGRRTLELPSFLVAMLDDHLARRGLTAADASALVFAAPDGGPLRPSNFRSPGVGPALRAAGFEGEGLTFHHLRHSAVGLLIDANAALAVMQQRMDASIRTLTPTGTCCPPLTTPPRPHLEGLFPDPTGEVTGTLLARKP